MGSRDYSTHGAHGAQKFMRIIHFYYWHECAEFLRGEDCEMVGFCVSQPHAIEINREVAGTKHATGPMPIDHCTFVRSACFAVGPKVLLTAEIASVCDRLVYVPLPLPQFEHCVHVSA
ncbi:hypothetical protein EON64_07825, partial [archaeon]